jgi:putative oxidoreductase
MTVLHRFSPTFYAILRIASGALFACHGAQKLFGVLGGHVMTGDPWGLGAGIIEFVGGILIMLGLFTGPAAFVASGEMAVAYFKVHAPGGFWPIENHGELAALYCFLFLYIASQGSGLWGLDRLLGRRRILP